MALVKLKQHSCVTVLEFIGHVFTETPIEIYDSASLRAVDEHQYLEIVDAPAQAATDPDPVINAAKKAS